MFYTQPFRRWTLFRIDSSFDHWQCGAEGCLQFRFDKVGATFEILLCDKIHWFTCHEKDKVANQVDIFIDAYGPFVCIESNW